MYVCMYVRMYVCMYVYPMISPCLWFSIAGQRAENAAGEDREARGEICESGALQQDPHGGAFRG